MWGERLRYSGRSEGCVAHIDDICEEAFAGLIKDLLSSSKVAKGPDCIRSANRYHIGLPALRPELLFQLLAQLLAAHLCILLFCHLHSQRSQPSVMQM